ncbi:MAG: hypothetical protein C4340_03625, partial [Armatimonadota bacterium]
GVRVERLPALLRALTEKPEVFMRALSEIGGTLRRFPSNLQKPSGSAFQLDVPASEPAAQDSWVPRIA